MSELIRLSLSIEKALFDKFEKLVEKHKYVNRSEFIRDMIRDRLVSEEWQGQHEVLGTITLIYDHHKRELSEKLTDLQHHHHNIVLASTHLHLTEEICAEMIMLKGKADAVSELTDKLRQQRGVLHASLTMSSTGINLD